MLCSLRGTPFLYYGDEIGLRDLSLKREQILDPPGRRFWPLFKGRDRYRAPMPWNGDVDGGFGTNTPWLPLPADWKKRNVYQQQRDSGSLFNCWRSAILLKKSILHCKMVRWSSSIAMVFC